MRKLVTIRKITGLRPIEGADMIELAELDGWTSVVKKGDFQVGDLVCYAEIDSFLPDGNSSWQFLVDKSSRVFEGQRGHLLRSVRLRGCLSQGLVLPLTAHAAIKDANDANIGEDVTELLGIKKWEPEIPACLAGLVKGNFPGFIPKTDQERCNNLLAEIFVDNAASQYEVTTKLDGTSCTIYRRDGELGVCSRNLELKLCDENKDNTLVRVLYDTLLYVALPAIGRNLAIQGEVMGPGIQKNREQLKRATFFVYDIYDIDRQVYCTPAERATLMEQLCKFCPELQHVPIVAHRANLLDTLGISNGQEHQQLGARGAGVQAPGRQVQL
jgi:RNA ligase (TIGR02306 family)